jgi:hypothetical protein
MLTIQWQKLRDFRPKRADRTLVKPVTKITTGVACAGRS